MSNIKSKKYSNVYTDENNRIFYRLKVKAPDGRKIDTKVYKTKEGLPFSTQREAYLARSEHEMAFKSPVSIELKKMTLSDVYNHYLQSLAGSKAPSTLRKQDSMWRNHVNPRFGNRDICSISIVELSSFLDELYETYAYKYVEGFLKFFYLLFGHAVAIDALPVDRYDRMFEIRGKRLTMPKMKQTDLEDDLDGATIYSENELQRMESLFDSEDGNLLCAFYLGIYCGLRISECFALRWRDINFEEGTLEIKRQMSYYNGELKICPVKTLTSVRTIVIPTKLFEYLCYLRDFQSSQKELLGMHYKNTERVYDEVDKKWLSDEERDFVNRKSDGSLLTINSMKYWSKLIKDKLDIDFKYHNLRHTYASHCALNNVNLYMLMSMMGHKKIETTKKYYINTNNDIFKKKALEIIDNMYNFSGLITFE